MHQLMRLYWCSPANLKDFPGQNPETAGKTQEPASADGVRSELLGALADEIDRVDLLALVQDFEVQVGAGGAAGVAH